MEGEEGKEEKGEGKRVGKNNAPYQHFPTSSPAFITGDDEFF